MTKMQITKSLRDPGKFLTLDTKLLAALTKVARGELSREILIFKETEASKSRAVRGRQVLYLFDQYFKTNEEVGSLYSVEDLLKVRLLNDDLSTFINNWESVWAKSRKFGTQVYAPPQERFLQGMSKRQNVSAACQKATGELHYLFEEVRRPRDHRSHCDQGLT